MKEDNEGFLYPNVDESLCVNCHICENVCPVLNQSPVKSPIKVYAATNSDEAFLTKSSSGGIFTLLAEKILADGGVVFGAAFNDKWEVCHTYVEALEDLHFLRGSKYVQSNIGTSYKDAEKFLKAGRKVLFSGTPCQISGLKLSLRKDYEKLWCVDVICHGVPSPGIWHNYLDTILSRPKGVVGGNTVLLSLKERPVITGISFRDKTYGWRKFGFVLHGRSAVKADRNSVLSSYSPILLQEFHSQNLYMRGFLNDLYLRPSCYECPARHGKSQSDILLGDFWGILRRHPEFYNSNGVSLVLTYTEKGDSLFRSLNCKCIDATYEDALDSNINIEKDNTIPFNRHPFFDEYRHKGVHAIGKYCNQIEFKNIKSLKGKALYIIKKMIGR